MASRYQRLIIWQKARVLVKRVYEDLIPLLPQEEKFGLSDQMRRAVVSIPSNIAEGCMRGTKKDFKRFLYIALGSTAELETQVLLVEDLELMTTKITTAVRADLEELIKIMNAFIKKL